MTTNLIATKLHKFVLAPSICPHCGEDVNTKILRVTGDTVRDHFDVLVEDRQRMYGVAVTQPILVVVVKATPPRGPLTVNAAE